MEWKKNHDNEYYIEHFNKEVLQPLNPNDIIKELMLMAHNYKNPNYGWLIELANPTLGSLEFKIKDGSILLIPYPLETSLKDYQDKILNYKKYYGI